MGIEQTLWLKIDTARQDRTRTIVVAAGLLSTNARWDGKGWFSKGLGRHINATHWHPFTDALNPKAPS